MQWETYGMDSVDDEYDEYLDDFFDDYDFDAQDQRAREADVEEQIQREIELAEEREEWDELCAAEDSRFDYLEEKYDPSSRLQRGKRVPKR